MTKRLRLVILLGLAMIFCLIMVFWSVRSYGSSPWQNWQTKYFQARISDLQGTLPMVDEEERARKLQEIKDWQQKKPAVQEIRLSSGRIERCTTCHMGIEEISASHTSDSIGCTSCHGGNGLSLDEKTAHEGMYGGGHPGQLEVTPLSCGGSAELGQCHSGNRQEIDNQVDLMTTSLMASKGGELSMTRYMYGLDIPPKVLLKPRETAAKVEAPFNHRAEEPKFQQNCLSACHQTGGELPGLKVQANGCESCHVLSNAEHTYEGNDVTIPRDQLGYGISHSLTVQIPYTQCNQCHNQGESKLYTMDFIPRPDLERVKASPPPDKENLETRWKNVYSPGLVFTKCEVNLDCIDCHTRKEAMGDGEMYFSEWKTLKIQCQDCHGSMVAQPIEWKITDKSDIAWTEARINPAFPPLKLGDIVLKTAKGEELAYVRRENDQWFNYRKTNGEKYQIPQVLDSKCLQEPDKQSSDDCHQCHDVSKDQPSSGGK
ncbi:MAG TPA: multiheme c-type cytochrome [Desulfosporosinus sp.]|nr:multiheme c-type cytochrome [Desulfosporosinus sp.]